MINLYKQKFTRLQQEIFSLLCVHVGEELSQREIAGFLKVSPTAISKSIGKLQKESLVRIEKGKNTNLVSLNRDAEIAIQLKRVENLKRVYESGLAEFLKGSFPGCTIVLFGSYSRGEDTIKSDVDIAVVGTNEKEVDLKIFEKILSREITINFYRSFMGIHKNLRNNLFAGIILEGSIEWNFK